MLYGFLVYCGISIGVGLIIAGGMLYDHYIRIPRSGFYSPNKLGLGLVIAGIIGCPIVNVLAVLYLFILPFIIDAIRSAWSFIRGIF
jgi:hypothetical protein